MLLTLAIAVSALSAFAGEEKVTSTVLNAFNNEFTTAKEVEWTAGNNYFKATFKYNNMYVFAFYSTEGELLGLTHYLSPVDLPMSLQNNIQKEYKDYWISDLFEMVKDGTTSYYITLEKADKTIILHSSGGNEWSLVKKIKKV